MTIYAARDAGSKALAELGITHETGFAVTAKLEEWKQIPVFVIAHPEEAAQALETLRGAQIGRFSVEVAS